MNSTDSALPTLSQSAIKRQARLDNQGKRNFGGKLDNFTDNRERHFYQRMLKAYLKGQDAFPFGFQYLATGRFPVYHNVEFTDQFRNPDQLDALLANGYTDPGKVFGGIKPSKKQLKAKARLRTEQQWAEKKAKIGESAKFAAAEIDKAATAMQKVSKFFGRK